MPKSDRDKCRLCLNTSVCVGMYEWVCVPMRVCVKLPLSTHSRRFSAFFNML